LRAEPLAREVAPDQFDEAEQSLAAADRAYEEKEPLEIVEHNAYLALRNAQVAGLMIAEETARKEVEQGEVERARVQLEAREREAARAQAAAAQAQSQAEQAQALAEQRGAEIERQAQEAQAAQQRAANLESELADLKAQQTERGLVLTLDDVLFDTGHAVLKSGADSTVERLVAFMNDHPERRILIEGHTDSTGSDELNRQLSEERADALRDALLERGIAIGRIATRGLGEAYPLASNDSSGGRQLNRRVEIVISDQAGEFPAAAERTADSR
jgi:outer membrane protein OmpA-like peptidoglycan-associated protein